MKPLTVKLNADTVQIIEDLIKSYQEENLTLSRPQLIEKAVKDLQDKRGTK
jgi:hypothetical protein